MAASTAYYYSGNAVITLPWHPITDVTLSINPEIGRQVFDCTTVNGVACTSYTYWDVGLDFNCKASRSICVTGTPSPSTTSAIRLAGGPAAQGLGEPAFVATLKFDTSISALK